MHGHRMVLCPLSFVHTLGTQVVFRPLCSVSRRHFCKRSVARSYGYAKKLIVGKTPQNQRKTRAHRDPVPTLVPEYKVSTFNLVPRAFPLNNGWGGKRPPHPFFKCVIMWFPPGVDRYVAAWNIYPWSFKMVSFQSRNFKVDWTTAKRCLIKAYITT